MRNEQPDRALARDANYTIGRLRVILGNQHMRSSMQVQAALEVIAQMDEARDAG